MFTNLTHVVLYHAVISVACAQILRKGIWVFVYFTTMVRREWTQHFHQKSEGKARDDKLILSIVVVGTRTLGLTCHTLLFLIQLLSLRVLCF